MSIFAFNFVCNVETIRKFENISPLTFCSFNGFQGSPNHEKSTRQTLFYLHHTGYIVVGFDWPQMDKNLRSYSQKRETHCWKFGQNLGVQNGNSQLEIALYGHVGGPQFLFPGQFLNMACKSRPQDRSKVGTTTFHVEPNFWYRCSLLITSIVFFV